MAGLSGNAICFCEPYYPHAWPVKYQQSMAFDGVGLGVFGYTLVALSKSLPYVLTGSHPENMSMAFASHEPLPCVSKRGVVSLDASVFYPSVNGYVVVSPGGVGKATAMLYTNEEWAPLNPSTMAAAVFDGRIFLSYEIDATTGGMLTINLQEGELLDNTILVSAIHADPETALIYVVQDTTIGQYDADEAARLVMAWRSKEFVLPNPVNLGAARIDADFTQDPAVSAALQAARDAVIAANAALLAGGDLDGAFNETVLDALPANGDILADVPPITYDSLQFGLIANGVEKATVTVTDDKPFRLPSGFKDYRFAVRVSGTIKVKSIVVAETMLGLKQG
jgi:hypothetical protein